MGLKSCAEDIELTESFHDRVGVQDSLLDPLCNLVALPGCGWGSHHSIELHEGAGCPCLQQKQPCGTCAQVSSNFSAYLREWCPLAPSSPPGAVLTKCVSAELDPVSSWGTSLLCEMGVLAFPEDAFEKQWGRAGAEKGQHGLTLAGFSVFLMAHSWYWLLWTKTFCAFSYQVYRCRCNYVFKKMKSSYGKILNFIEEHITSKW